MKRQWISADRKNAKPRTSVNRFVLGVEMQFSVKNLAGIAAMQMGLIATGHAASLDCAKAASKVEELICTDGALLKLDSEMSDAYIKVRVGLGNKESSLKNLQKSQQNWLKSRNACKEVKCLRNAYAARLASLRGSIELQEFASDPKRLKPTDRYDYVLDPKPQISWNGVPAEDYPAPKDPTVCQLYLENLRYFAKRNALMSCERPIAPHLQDKIQKVEWENLDPDRYEKLFKEIISWTYLGGGAPTVDKLKEKINKGSYLFRRAKIDVRGEATFYGLGGTQLPDQIKKIDYFNIVQFGPDSINPDNPERGYGCFRERQKSWTQANSDMGLKLFIVNNELNAVYNQLVEWVNSSWGNDLRVINGRIYSERAESAGDIQLMSIQFDAPIQLVQTCLFHMEKKPISGK